MQTFLVHNRHPLALLGDLGWRNFLFFQLYVGSLIVSSLIHTVFAISLCVAVVQHGPSWPRLADGWDIAYLLVLVVGYGGAFGLALRGLWRQGQIDLAAYQLLLPVYWLLHAAAAVRASIELLVRPYFWSKTRHGETRMVRVIATPEAARRTAADS
jgi:glycosyltransferase XagB